MARLMAALCFLLACAACTVALLPGVGNPSKAHLTRVQPFASDEGSSQWPLIPSPQQHLSATATSVLLAQAGGSPPATAPTHRPATSAASGDARLQGAVDARTELAAHEMALALAACVALVTLLIAALALYSAARDRMFLLYSGYATSALLFVAAANGHVYADTALDAMARFGDRYLPVLMLVFNAMALLMLLRLADARNSTRAMVRKLELLLPIMALAAALMAIPATALAVYMPAVALLACATAMGAGLLASVDAAFRRKPMAVATGFALLVLLTAAIAHAAMAGAYVGDGIWTRHGYQYAVVLLSLTLFVGLVSRLSVVRKQLDQEATARRASENRLREVRARTELGQLLRDRLRGLHPEEVARDAFRLLVQHVQSTMPGTQAVVLGQAFIGDDLMLVQEDGAPTGLGQVVLESRRVVRAQVQARRPVQLRLRGGRVSDSPEVPLHALVPISVGAPAWAALVMRDPGREAMEPDQLEVCVELAKLTARYVDEAHASIQLRQTAEHDALTGTMNRRSLDQVLAREFQQARLASLPVTVLFIDIDWFKRVNDQHGHACGDHWLRCIATVLRSELRPNDALGRYGGEEFLVALPGHDAAASRIIAERLRQAVERCVVEWHGEPMSLTISVGLAARRESDASVDEMLERADKALYTAKREGRNRVCVAPAVFA